MSQPREITATTKLIGLLGSPVSHVSSPKMHNLAYKKLGLDYVYLAFDVLPENLQQALEGIKALQIRGFNVAKPHREKIIPYLDDISPAARLVGTVNTVVNDNGKLIGHMTDGMGYVRALKEEGIDIQGKKITMIGSGGAGTAIQIQSALDGAREISIFNPVDDIYSRAEETIEKLKVHAPNCRIQLFPLDDKEKLREEIASSDILADATPVGMHPLIGQSNITDLSVFRSDLVVTHTVYNPQTTKLLEDARAQSCKVVLNGLGMLLWQGAIGFEMWLGQTMPVDEIRKDLY